MLEKVTGEGYMDQLMNRIHYEVIWNRRNEHEALVDEFAVYVRIWNVRDDGSESGFQFILQLFLCGEAWTWDRTRHAGAHHLPHLGCSQ